MAKRRKKPKPLKHPKKPKKSAALSVWKRYDERCKDIDKRNHERMKAYHAHIGDIGTHKKQKEALIRKYSH